MDGPSKAPAVLSLWFLHQTHITCSRRWFTMPSPQVQLTWFSCCIAMLLAAFAAGAPVEAKDDPVSEYLCDLGHRHPGSGAAGHIVPLPRNPIAVAAHSEHLPSSEHAAPDWHTLVEPCSHEGGKVEGKAQQT
ncbi:Secreted protein [Pleurotus pulmonarius]